MCVLFDIYFSDNKVLRLWTVGRGMKEMALIITMEPGIVLIFCKQKIASELHRQSSVNFSYNLSFTICPELLRFCTIGEGKKNGIF